MKLLQPSRSLRRSLPRVVLLLGLATAAGGSLLWVRETRSTGASAGAAGEVFRFEPGARTVLRELWRESVAANEERVACIGGRPEGGVYRITHAEPVPHERADSLHVTPEASLDRCGPPRWAGTVHTHIVPVSGQPHVTLSPADRAVMRLWRQRWRAEGVFCVLYTERDATCESGNGLSGRVRYDEGRDRPVDREVVVGGDEGADPALRDVRAPSRRGAIGAAP